jgi:cysteine synthase
VAKQLECEGFAVADSGTAGTLTGVIHVFKAEENAVQLDLTLVARSPAPARQLTRRYQMTSSYWGATPVHLEQAVLQVLTGLQQQIAADTELMEALGRNGSGVPRG